MMLLRRFLSSQISGSTSTGVKFIQFFPMYSELNKFGKVSNPNPHGNVSPFTQRRIIKAAEFDALNPTIPNASEHKIAKEKIKNHISSAFKYAENQLLGRKDLLVHISTSEFFYYSNTGVFSEDDMLEIIHHIENIAEKTKNGVHFNFGTFPLYIKNKPIKGSFFDILFGNGNFERNLIRTLEREELSDKSLNQRKEIYKYLKKIKEGEAIDFGKILKNNNKPLYLFSNISICGESGGNEKVHLYSKMHRAEFDPFYLGFIDFFSNDTRVVESKTPNGEEFIKIYEICLNHSNGVADASETFRKLSFRNEIILGIHEVISSTIISNKKYILSEVFSHNDTGNSNKRMIVRTGDETENINLSPGFMQDDSVKFINTDWIETVVFEHEVKLGALIFKRAMSSEITLEKNKNSEAPLPKCRVTQHLGKDW